MLCRPERESLATAELLRALGAGVVIEPTIQIGPPEDWGPVDRLLPEITGFDWLVFSSGNGVRYFLGRFLQREGDIRRLAGPRLAAMGPGTAAALADFHLRADVVPPEYRAESLVEVLAPEAAGKRFLLVRASRGRPILADGLRAAGGEVVQVVAYDSRDVASVRPEVVERLQAGEIQWTFVTSSSIARSAVRLFGQALRQTRIVSISPVTTAVLKELGFPVAVEAREYTLRGMLAAVLQAEGTTRPVGLPGWICRKQKPRSDLCRPLRWRRLGRFSPSARKIFLACIWASAFG